MRPAELSLRGKLLLTGVCLFAVALVDMYLLPRDEQKGAAPLRVGAGDDVTGILLSEIAACAEADGSGELLAGSYLFVDCCASAAQWALQAEEIDMGFYCAQAALEMVKANSDFEIYGPIVMNGEVIAHLSTPEEIRTLGIPRKRQFLQDIAESAYPQIEECRELNRSYMLFTLESGDVDGVVLDVGDAHRAGDAVQFAAITQAPYISYCMVVRRDIEETEAFARFLSYYEQAADRLNTPQRLVETMGMDEAFWETSGTEFLYLP